jgi:regulator of sigma E protease
MTWLLTVVVFLLMISALVAAHEYGHFLFAKICGMEVEEFAIGLGLPAWTYATKNGTAYNLRPIPFGGFVKIKGMVAQEDGSEIHVENGFYNKSPFRRFVVLLAGPMFSILAGVVVLTALFTVVGEPSKEAVMGDLISGPSPARAAGIQPGDVVESIDGNPAPSFLAMHSYISTRAQQPVTLVLKRGGETLTKTVVPAISETATDVLDADGNPTGKVARQAYIGVRPSDKLERTALGASVVDAVDAPLEMGAGLYKELTHPKTLSQSVGGPVAIVAATDQASKRGLYQILFLAAVLSISLGFMNLLPIWPLDGGQIVVAIIEMFRGRRLSFQVQSRVASLGMALVGMLVVTVFWTDIKHLAGPKPEEPKLAIPANPETKKPRSEETKAIPKRLPANQ